MEARPASVVCLDVPLASSAASTERGDEDGAEKARVFDDYHDLRSSRSVEPLKQISTRRTSLTRAVGDAIAKSHRRTLRRTAGGAPDERDQTFLNEQIYILRENASAGKTGIESGVSESASRASRATAFIAEI